MCAAGVLVRVDNESLGKDSRECGADHDGSGETRKHSQIEYLQHGPARGRDLVAWRWRGWGRPGGCRFYVCSVLHRTETRETVGAVAVGLAVVGIGSQAIALR